jgi:hypothetical protein
MESATKTYAASAKTASHIPVLDDFQIGHLRHFENLSLRPENDWTDMQGLYPMQEDYGAYRYQIAYMAIAHALAHVHHLPAAPGYFHDTFNRLIGKMLSPEVWLYWRNASIGKGPFTMDLPERTSRIDPVAEENIMYSAYLQVMTLLNTKLFDDRTYEQPESIKFEFRPLLFGQHLRQTTTYDQKTLNDTVYWNMVESGYLGVACEPNCVFQICNQVPILGFRLHDQIYGGSLAEEVTAGYEKAWGEFGGLLDPDGHYWTLKVTELDELKPGNIGGPWADAWCGMLLNMWQPELVQKNYRRQIDEWLTRANDGTVSVIAPFPPNRDLDGVNGEFGWVAAWASEMGDDETVSGMLAHADQFMSPKWKDGGYFYPRCDRPYDANGKVTAVNPTVGNALLPYARLNVKDGLRKLYENPWTESHFTDPAVVWNSDSLDFRSAKFVPEEKALHLTICGRKDRDAPMELKVDRVWDRGDWAITRDGEMVMSATSSSIVDASGLAAVRDGSAIRIDLGSQPEQTLVFHWS